MHWFSIGHAFREQNQEADQLANDAMDKGMGRTVGRVAAAPVAQPQEFEGVVRNGTVELLNGTLPDGTRVQVRVKR